MSLQKSFESVDRYLHFFQLFKTLHPSSDHRYVWLVSSIRDAKERLPRVAIAERDALEQLAKQIEEFSQAINPS